MKITHMKSITGHDLPERNTKQLADLYAPVGANRPIWKTVMIGLIYGAIGWLVGYMFAVLLAVII